MVEKQTFTNPIALSTSYIVSGTAGATSAAVASLSTFTNQPDVPRVLLITPGTSTVDVGTCTITVSGTNFLNQSISEDFTFTNNTSGGKAGAKAFKTVSSASWAASCEDGSFAATWSIGVGESLGLKNCLDSAGHIVQSTIDGTKEATAATMAVNASVVESNTADFNGTMNGASDFELFYFQNFRCAP